jgi:SPP1 gp7 family putative phage head morphogenesis protein
MAEDPPTVRQTFGLPPADTVRAWEQRTELRTTVRWSEMWADEHARAFTVAKVARLDLLQTIRESLDDVARNGGTFEQWQARLRPELEKAGWWGRVQDRSLTGTGEAVFVGPRRLRTIYHTNMRVSRAAGHWARIQRVKDIRPFLRYVTVGDHRVRPQHRLWGGPPGKPTILPVDHPWWAEHFPPNGWNCRCTVVQHDQADLDRRGWQVSDSPPPEGPPRRFRRAGGRGIETVPDGFDPGWAYNPGAASLRAVGDKAAASLDAAWRAGRIEEVRATLLELVEGRDFESVLAAYRRLDPDGTPIERAAAEQTSFPLLVIDADVREAIGARTAIARLSAETEAKQFRTPGRAADVGFDEYRAAQRIAESPEHRLLSKPRHVTLIGAYEGRPLVVVVKSAADGEEVYVQSVRRANRRAVAAMLARWPVVGSLLGPLFAPAEADADNADDEGDDNDA